MGHTANQSLLVAILLAATACASSDTDGGNATDDGMSGTGRGLGSGGSGGSPSTSQGGSPNPSAAGTSSSGSSGGTGGTSAPASKADAGSTAGGGGSGGAGGSNDHLVMPCSNLPQAGEWEKINPPDANPQGTYDDGTTEQIRVDPMKSGTIYLGVHNKGLHKSTDCGATWSHVNTGRNGPLLDHGSWWSTVIDPQDHHVLYAINGYGAGGLWKSTDGGVNWDQTIPSDGDVGKTLLGNFTNEVALDPTDHLHLLVTPHGSCNGAFASGCVGETNDGGTTWHIVKSPPDGEGGGPYIIDKNTWLLASGGLYRTGDAGKTWQNVAPNGATAMGGGNPLYRSPMGTYFIPSIQGVLESSDGLAWSLLPCGRTVGFSGSDKNLYGGDQWSSTYRTASLSDPTKWTTFPTPKGLPDGYGPPYMDYDRDHKLLYSSNFYGGAWRIVTP